MIFSSIPDSAVRILAPLGHYPLPKFLAAVALGRLPRLLLIAGFGMLVPIPAWLLLVPGLIGSAFGYRRLIPLLTDAGYRTIVVEPLAIGRSARPEPADYSLTAQADRIAAALDQLAVRGAIVIAHSVGASMAYRLAYRLAYRRPDLVAGIVSIDGGPAERVTTPARVRGGTP